MMKDTVLGYITFANMQAYVMAFITPQDAELWLRVLTGGVNLGVAVVSAFIIAKRHLSSPEPKQAPKQNEEN